MFALRFRSVSLFLVGLRARNHQIIAKYCSVPAKNDCCSLDEIWLKSDYLLSICCAFFGNATFFFLLHTIFDSTLQWFTICAASVFVCTLWPNYQHFVDDHRVLLFLFWFGFVSMFFEFIWYCLQFSRKYSKNTDIFGCCSGDGGISEGGGGDMFSHITLHYIRSYLHVSRLISTA